MSIDGAKVSLAIELLNITSHSLNGEQSPHRAVRSVIQANAALMDADFLDAFRYVVQSNVASNQENRLGYAVLLGDLGWALEPLADGSVVCADLALIALRFSLRLIGNDAPQGAYRTLLERFAGALLAVTHDSQTDEYRQAMDIFRFVLHSSHVLPGTQTRCELSISDRLLSWSEKNNIRTTLSMTVEILEGARARTSWIDEPELRFRCLYNLAQTYRYLTEATPWESIENALDACNELVAEQAVRAKDNWYVLALILQGTLLLDAAMITRVDNEEAEILQRALIVFTEARRCAERSEDFSNAMAARANLAEVYARRKTGDRHSNLEQAILEAESCLAAFRQTEKVGDVLTMCGKLGHYHLTLGLEGSRDHLADAMKYFEEALNIASSQNLIMKQAEFHACLGRAYAASDFDRAIEHFSAALGVLNAEANRDTYLDACLEFSKVLGRAERFKEGLEVLERAIHVLEEMRNGTSDLGMRRAVLDQGLAICREAAKFHLRLGNVDRAWMYCCMSKARFTIEYQSTTDANTRSHLALLLRASKLDRDYLKLRELELMSTSDSIESVERRHFLSKMPAIKQELKEAREAIKNVQSTRSPGPHCDIEWFEQSLDRTKERLASSETLLLDFYFVETELLVFVFDPTSRLLRCEQFSRNVFETVHEKYVAGPTGYFENDNFLWRVCLEETINAVGASLKWERLTIGEGEAQALLIVPDGVLQFIPFHAIPIHGRCTIDVFPKGVSYAMTAVNSGSLVVERKHDTSLVTVVGNDEELIFSVLEGNYVRKLWRAHRGEAIEVTQPSRGVLERAESIHVSAHGYSGFLDAGINAGSGLTYESVLLMRLSGCKLVVIGACESALSDLSSKSGDSVDFAEAFRLAGASNVVAALWTVDDLATFILILRFYQVLWEEPGHEPRVESQAPRALGEAQRWLRGATGEQLRQWLARTLESVGMKDELAFVLERTRVWRANACPFSSPYYWAPFVVR
jgi:tetratricopeptide (TPR) repeat protein